MAAWVLPLLPPHPQGEVDAPLRCIQSGCPLAAHPPCLARYFLQDEPHQFLPVEGRCPW